MPGRSREIEAINGLRGAGALAILLYHMGPSLAHSPLFAPATLWFAKYYLFLDLFFMVSGFALAAGYARVFADGVRGEALRRFWTGRLARVLPLYWATLAVAVAIEFALFWGVKAGLFAPGFEPFDRPAANPENLVTTALLLQAWGLHDKLTWNIPAWFVSALMGAYLAFPFLIAAAQRLNERMRATVLIALCGSAMLILHGLYANEYLQPPNDVAVLRALVELMLGAGLFLMRPQVLAPAMRSMLQIGCALAVFASLHLKLWDGFALLLFAAFVVLIRTDEGALARALKARPMFWLGRISFSLYMIHFLVLFLIDSLGKMRVPLVDWFFWTENMWLNLILRVVIVIALASVVHRRFEEPARRIMQNWMGKAALGAPATRTPRGSRAEARCVPAHRPRGDSLPRWRDRKPSTIAD